MEFNWPTKKLGEACEFIFGYSFRTDDFNENGKGLPVIRIGDIDKGITEKFYDGDYDKKYLVKKGDILIGLSGSIKVNKWKGEKALLNQRIVKIHNFKPEVLGDFIFYQLPSILKRLEVQIAQGTVKNVLLPHLSNLKVLIPPLPIQQKIVERLDAIKKAQELNDKQIALAEELFQSLLNKELNLKIQKWGVKKLKEVCIKITDGTHRTPKYVDKGIPFLTVKNVKEDGLDFRDVQYISKEEHNRLIKRCHPQKGDVLYTKVGTTGIAKMINMDREFSIFVSVALLKVNKEKILPEFLEKVLNISFCRRQAYLYTQGAANQNLVIRDIERIKIPLPPLEAQKKIVEKLSAVQEYKKKLLKQKQLLQELFESILNKSMKGHV